MTVRRTQRNHDRNQICGTRLYQIRLTNAGFCYDPRKPQKQHDSENVEETWYKDALYPTQFHAFVSGTGWVLLVRHIIGFLMGTN